MNLLRFVVESEEQASMTSPSRVPGGADPAPSACVHGLRIGFADVHSTRVMNLDPNGTDTIKGGGAGKDLILDPGERVLLEAYATGLWVVSSAIGWDGDFGA